MANKRAEYFDLNKSIFIKVNYGISVTVEIRARRFSHSCVWVTSRQTHQSLCGNVASHNFITTKVRHGGAGKVELLII